MYNVSLEQFLAFVEQRQAAPAKRERVPQTQREKVLRPDQQMKHLNRSQERHLATCPQCDALVDSEIIHPRSGLCPICHDEQARFG